MTSVDGATFTWMSDTSPIKLIGKHGLPDELRELMIKHGVDPRSTYVESAEGWRYGDSVVDLSTDAESEKTLAMVEKAIQLAEAAIAAAEAETAASPHTLSWD